MKKKTGEKEWKGTGRELEKLSIWLQMASWKDS